MADSKGPQGACRNQSKFCLDGFSVTTGQIVLKYGDMIDMDMKFCKRVSKGPQGAWPTPIFS